MFQGGRGASRVYPKVNTKDFISLSFGGIMEGSLKIV